MHTPIDTSLASVFQVIDIKLNDVKTGPGKYDVSETITVTFGSKEVARTLGDAVTGMPPGQAEDLAVALVRASQEWMQGGALYKLHPVTAEAATV